MGFSHVVFLEAEAAQDRGDPQVHRVAVEAPEILLALAVPHEHGLMRRVVEGRVGELVLEAMQLLLEREQRAEGLARLVHERPAAVFESVLREVADGEVGWRDDLARVRLVDARQDLQQRRLAGAVGATQPHTVTRVQLPGDIVEQHTIGKGLADSHQLQHAGDRSRRASTPNA